MWTSRKWRHEERELSVRAAYLALMQDGKWRTNAQAAYELRANESVVGRKRRLLEAQGYDFEARSTADPQVGAYAGAQAPWAFRLVQRAIQVKAAA